MKTCLILLASLIAASCSTTPSHKTLTSFTIPLASKASKHASAAEFAQPAPGPEQSIFYVNGQKGERVTQGKEMVVSQASGWTFDVQNLQGKEFRFSISKPGAGNSWNLFVGLPPGVDVKSLELDKKYSSVRTPVLSPDKNVGHIDLSGDGRGNNTVHGFWSTKELVVSPDGTVEHAAIDFFLVGDVETASVFGAIRYRSRLPLPSFYRQN